MLREVYSELPVSFFKEGDVNALAELLMLKLQLNTDVARTREYICLLYTSIGVDDFGIYNVVGGMVMLFSFLSVALMVSTQRFMNVEMGLSLIHI